MCREAEERVTGRREGGAWMGKIGWQGVGRRGSGEKKGIE